ncbi:AAA family ATPase [Rhodococcus sp. JS3073]|uniref:AAA family ATPase n=1 Tax=Rhodococcus sp. JS3073 TaxID=3002901 RepID=UPI002285D114|nr:AAA family ATPase [Rhodococcus sp. JS3073]WAM19501.1 AAA family ATPase [Rhodococcus sp. JS3073]
MTDVVTPQQRLDPRGLLSEWANSSDEWVRHIVRQVLNGGVPLGSDEEAQAYNLFRQEKAFDIRELPTEELLATVEREDEAIEPLTLTSLSAVTGVNALVEGGGIEPHEGLTILFGENGTGKTGYSRIFKALAASRTADVVLGNIDAATPRDQSALVGYTLGSESKTYAWTGQQGVAPFTRMSIFDSPSVSFHVDDDLEYVYVPAALALFNHVIAGIKSVQDKIDQAVQELRSGSTGIVSRFPRAATVYPLIETLGAATDLEQLKSAADPDPNVDARIATLRRTVAALEADTISAEIKLQQRVERILTQASTAAAEIAAFDVAAYNRELATLTGLDEDYRTFRVALFAAADLPADPDDTWSAFLESGEAYQAHLSALGAHDADRCLYCRQPLGEAARALIGKYSEYLEDKITTEIAASRTRLRALTDPVTSIQTSDVATFVNEYADTDDKPTFHVELDRILSLIVELIDDIRSASNIEPTLTECAKADSEALSAALVTVTQALGDLRKQAATRAETLAEKKKELVELEAAAELTKSWTVIESHVHDAKQADRLTLLAKPMSSQLRSVTVLAKTASDQMINESFDTLFNEECGALRAPELQVEFVGRQGRAQRRKVLSGKHRPSKVLSEGEQKVLAIADFLAEARLTGITAPVIFDDPVSSLDHRRINEVAQRIASLAETTQVVVFTHDIFFATTLLTLMEASKRCSYFQISDEDGKGQITRATGPRWDSLNNIKKNINETIQAAKSQQGDARAALVRTGYDWIRAWCEVFTETELLQGVTQRYQPNVRMTNLPKIKPGALPAAIETVNSIFEEACRYIDGHSQPLPSLSVSPTLAGLEEHWSELTKARTSYNSAAE